MQQHGGLALGMVLALSGAVHAGVVIEMGELDVASGKVTPRNAMYVQDGALRTVPADGSTAFVFRDSSMILLDSSSRTYRVVDKAAMDKMAAKVNDMMAAVQARMASMPPEQRAAMEHAMQGLGQRSSGAALAPKAHTFDAVDTGASATAGGRRCHRWNSLRDGKPTEQLCVVPETSLPGANEVMSAIRNAAAFSAQLQETVATRGGAIGAGGARASNPADMMSQSLEMVQKLGGVPVATRHMDATTGSLAATEMVMTKWQQRNIDAAQFEIPAGYTRKDLMDGRAP